MYEESKAIVPQPIKSRDFLSKLPADLLIKIFLDILPEEIQGMTAINHLMNKLLQSNEYWRQKFQKHFPHHIQKYYKIPYRNWRVWFFDMYFYDYNAIPVHKQKLFSFAKDNDVNALVASQSLLFDINYLDNNQMHVLNWLQKKGYQATLNRIFQVAKQIYLNSSIEEGQNMRVSLQHTTLLFWAINCFQPMDEILLLVGNCNRLGRVQTQQGYELIHLAAEIGHLPLLKFLLDKKPTLLNLQDQTGRTPLHFASLKGQVEIVNYLLTKKANIDAVTRLNVFLVEPNITPLHYASLGGHTAVVQLLLDANANPAIKTHITLQYPIHIAVEQGNIDVVAAFVTTKKIVMELRDNQNYTPLMQATRLDRIEVVRLLIQEGSPLECQKLHKTYPIQPQLTALYIAAQWGHANIASQLVKAGANPFIPPDNQHVLPIHIATQEGHLAIVRVLVRAHPTLLHAKCANNGTPILWAAKHHHPFVLSFLLKRNAQCVDMRTYSLDESNGKTALNWACEYGHSDMIKNLLRAGASIRAGKPLITNAISNEIKIWLDLADFIEKRSSLFYRNPIFSLFSREPLDREKKVAAANALKSVIFFGKSLITLKDHGEMLKRGKLGHIFERYIESQRTIVDLQPQLP